MKVKFHHGLLCGSCNWPMHVGLGPGNQTMYCPNPQCDESNHIYDLPEIEVTVHAELVENGSIPS